MLRWFTRVCSALLMLAPLGAQAQDWPAKQPIKIIVPFTPGSATDITARTVFEQGDLFKTDLSRATVISMFLLQEINLKLRPQLLNLKPGTRLVTNTFHLGDWKPDKTITVDDPTRTNELDHVDLHLWIVK